VCPEASLEAPASYQPLHPAQEVGHTLVKGGNYVYTAIQIRSAVGSQDGRWHRRGVLVLHNHDFLTREFGIDEHRFLDDSMARRFGRKGSRDGRHLYKALIKEEGHRKS